MIYCDIQVPILQGKRIQKKTNYVYEIIEKSRKLSKEGNGIVTMDIFDFLLDKNSLDA